MNGLHIAPALPLLHALLALAVIAVWGANFAVIELGRMGLALKVPWPRWRARLRYAESCEQGCRRDPSPMVIPKKDVMSAPNQPLAHELIRLQDISQSYRMAGQPMAVLDRVSLTIGHGESCAIVGPSGSGKSTLLNILGLLHQPASGCISLGGHDMSRASADERARIRNQLIGFVFQSYNLLPRLSALDNVALPLLYRGCPRAEARQRAQAQLERFGLGHRGAHRPAELSGGQRQRVAIARALVGEPALILADEPTGNLDGTAAREVMDILLALNRVEGVTLVMVTHDNPLARKLGRCLCVQEGKVIEQSSA